MFGSIVCAAALLNLAVGSFEGNVRLLTGSRVSTKDGQGNVEVFHNGQWGSICDDEWDEAEGKVVCRALGFDSVDVVTHDNEFGSIAKTMLMDDLFCKGNEDKLTDCHFPGWQVQDCEPTELAGVRCVKEEVSTALPFVEKNDVLIVDAPSKPNSFYASLRKLYPNDLELRLLSGRTIMEGRVEVFDKQRNLWGVICFDGFGLLEATAVCRQVGYPYGYQRIQGSAFGAVNKTSLPTLIVGLKCTGDELNLADCLYSPQLGSCPDDEFAGVVCTEELPDLVIDKDELERSTYLEDRQLSFLTCSMEENCLSSSAYTVERHDYIYAQRRLLRFTTRVANIGTIPFRPFLPKDQWIWHACHQHYHSMEVFAHYDILNAKGEKVAEGHKASFCLEDNSCDQSAVQVFSCADRGDQGISVGCVDTYLHNIDCQWVDMTDVPQGNYTFRVSINPDYKLAEQTFDNNGANCDLIYAETYAAVRNCVFDRP